MTDLDEFETEFLKGFDFEILDNNFVDETFNSLLKDDSDVECVELGVTSTKPVEFDCGKRTEDDGNVTKSKGRRLSDQAQQPNLDILKQAVKRLKNADNLNGAGNDIITRSNEAPPGTETKQLTDRSKLKEKTIRTSQILQQPFLKRMVEDISKGLKIMILMRGPPGCGKSYLAREIIDSTTNDSYSDHIFSDCDYFYNQNECFNFDYYIKRSQEWNQERISTYVSNGWSPIIIDNTNIKKLEMNFYVRIAVKHGYVLKIVEPNTTWAKSADELEAVNIHNVQRKTIERMLSSFEPTTVFDLIRSAGVKYTKKLPQYRRRPPLS